MMGGFRSLLVIVVVFWFHVSGIEDVDEEFVCNFCFARVMTVFGLGSVVIC